MTSSARFDCAGLSLSGGGYRAAAFHVGVLSFLDEANILPNVCALSTASGGTIVGAFYAQCLARHVEFARFYERMYAFLRDVDVIDAALRRMRDHGKLITGAAEAYASLVDGTLGEVQRSADHLAEISFNATDMRNGPGAIRRLGLRIVCPRPLRGHGQPTRSLTANHVHRTLRMT